MTAPEESRLGFGAVYAPLPERSANRLAAWIADNRRAEPLVAAGRLAQALARPVERLREEPTSAAYLLGAIAAEIHDHRDELHGAP